MKATERFKPIPPLPAGTCAVCSGTGLAGEFMGVPVKCTHCNGTGKTVPPRLVERTKSPENQPS